MEAKGTYLLLRDVELVPFQHHIAVFPNLPENPFPAEFPDPADLLRRRRLMISILRPLPRGQEKDGRLSDQFFSSSPFRDSRPSSVALSPSFRGPPRRRLESGSPTSTPHFLRGSRSEGLSLVVPLPLRPNKQLQPREEGA